MVEPDHPELSVVRQCELISISRSGFYDQPTGESPLTLALMRLVDAQFLETPWYGSRQMARHLRREGHTVERKRVRRLMAKMGKAGQRFRRRSRWKGQTRVGADLSAAAHDGSASRAPGLSVSAAGVGD